MKVGLVGLSVLGLWIAGISPGVAQEPPDTFLGAQLLLPDPVLGAAKIPTELTVQDALSNLDNGTWEQSDTGWIYRVTAFDQLARESHTLALEFDLTTLSGAVGMPQDGGSFDQRTGVLLERAVSDGEDVATSELHDLVNISAIAELKLLKANPDTSGEADKAETASSQPQSETRRPEPETHSLLSTLEKYQADKSVVAPTHH